MAMQLLETIQGLTESATISRDTRGRYGKQYVIGWRDYKIKHTTLAEAREEAQGLVGKSRRMTFSVTNGIKVAA